MTTHDPGDLAARAPARPAPAALHAPTAFLGPSELAARCRAADWPEALRAAVQLVLDAPDAMSLYVGPTFVTLYNDAYRRILGAKHPGALGRPAAEVWAELWDAIGPQFAAARAGHLGPATVSMAMTGCC